MKKQCLVLFHLIIMPLVITISIISEGFPQSQEADSLIRVISGQPDNTGKADNLLKLARHFFTIDPDSAMVYYKQAFTLSNRLSYAEGMADALYMQSLILKGKADYTSSLDYNKRFLELSDSLQDSLRLAKGFYHQGTLYQEVSDYDAGFRYCNKSLAIFFQLNNTNGIIANYNCMANIFKRKSEYDSAAIYYLKAINILEKSGEERNLGVMYNNLGEIYLELSQLENARKYLNMSLEINKKYDDKKNMALSLTNLGRISTEENDFDQALGYYDQADSLYRQTCDSLGISDLYNNYGVVYQKQKNYPLAIQKFNKALDGYRELGIIRGIIVVLGNKAAVNADQGRYAEALKLHDSCLHLAYKQGSREYQVDALWNISDIYKKVGNYEKAFEYQTRYYELMDSIFDIEKAQVITNLTLKYEKEKDQAHILALEKDNLQKTNQRNAYLFSGLGIIVLTLFIVIYFRQRAAQDKIIARQKIRQLEEEKKLMAAKLLVEGQEEERKRIATELHDGLGVLLSATKMQFSIISDKSPENKVLIEKATRMLEQATGDVRKISHNMMPGLLTKLGFFEATEDLFENIGDTRGLNAICNISGSQDRLPENKEIMLYRIVQEMVNNTLKHAEARNIELQIHVLKGILDMKYSDDGKGFDVGKKLESESIGLKSIQSRVNFLNGTLVIESKPGEGVSYSIQIPV
jgi:signal transduction histidine kinase/Tfp pilus assembly protein PilF